MMLELTDVSASYGDLQVIREMSIQVDQASITAILGRNGAGKTSLLNTVIGISPTQIDGTILLDGLDVSKWPTQARVARGVGYVQENKRIFRQLTVEQNLMLGAFPLRRPFRPARHLVRPHLDRAYERFPLLAGRRKEDAGRLSGGQQQMLAIAQALMSSPKVLMLDEPSAGLSPALVTHTFEIIRQLREDGLAVLLVEQVVEPVLRIADTVVVMDAGRVAAQGAADAFSDASIVGQIYMRGART